MPRLRRLRHPRRRAVLPPRARAAPREHRLRLRHRLLVALPVLPRHLRDALDPRPRAGHRHRARHVPSRPVGVGRHRGRRRAVDRRQPPHPRDAPQRQPDDPVVQQPDLRADEGPVLPHVAHRVGDEVEPARVGRRPVQPGVAGARCRGDVRRAGDGVRPRRAQGGAQGGRPAPRHGPRRDLPELPDLQRRRVRGAQGPQPAGCPHRPPARRRGDHRRRRGRPEGAGAQGIRCHEVHRRGGGRDR